jgi:uncharacterized membrane protein
VHGQIDAIAILPAAIGVTVWVRDGRRRAWWAGLLIGVGAAIKVVPGLMVFALLPSARSRREAVELIGAALVAPVIACLPVVVASGTGWIGTITHYHGGVGLGGISLVAQPELPLNWLHITAHPLTGVSRWLILHGGTVAIFALLLAVVFVAWRRIGAVSAAVVLWLTFYAFGVSFFMQYMVWGLPFLLMAGYVWQVAVLELLLFAPVLVIYHGVHRAWEANAFYVAPMLLVWLVLTAGLAGLLRTIAPFRWRSTASGSI